MWRERIARWAGDDLTFAAPAELAAVAAAEDALGQPLPAALVALLRESDGVEGEYGLGLVWPLVRIVEDNLMFRTFPAFAEVYMPFDPLLFFADAGNGDQFAFPRTPARDEVFAWDHEDDSRRWVAGSLEKYLEWWLDGTMKL
jgi:hypothetical protein